MPRALIDVGIKLNTKEIKDQITSLANSLGDLGKNSNASDGVKRESDALLNELEAVYKRIDSLEHSRLTSKAFDSQKQELIAQINAIQQRTEGLQGQVQDLINILGSASSADFTSYINDIQAGMDRLKTSATETVEAVSKVTKGFKPDTEFSIFDSKSINEELREFREAQRIFREINQNRVSKKYGSYGATEQTGLKELKDRFSEILKLNKSLLTMDTDDAAFSKTALRLSEAAKDFISTYKQLDKAFSNEEHKFGENILGNYMSNGKSQAWDVEKVLERVSAFSKNASEKVRSVLNEMGAGNAISLDLDTSKITTTDISKKLQRAISAAQNYADSNPIQITVDLTTKWEKQSRKYSEAFKRMQAEVDNIQDETTKASFQSLLDDVGRGWGKEIFVQFKSSINDIEDEVNKTITKLKEDLQGADFVVSPTIKFEKSELEEARDALLKISKQLRDSLIGNTEDTEEGKQLKESVDDFTALQNRTKDITNSIESSISGLRELPDQLGITISEMERLDKIDMGQENAKALTEQLENVRSKIVEILSLFTSNSGLKNMLEGWKSSDLDIINDTVMGGVDKLRERSAVYTKSKKLFGDYSYGEDGKTHIFESSRKRAEASGEEAYIVFHSHPNKNVSTLSYGNNRNGVFTGDIRSWASQYRDDQKNRKESPIQVTVANGEVGVFDTNRFFKDFNKIDFTSNSINKKIGEARSKAEKEYNVGRNTSLFFDKLIDEYAGNFDSVMESMISDAFKQIGKEVPDDLSPIIKKIRESFSKRNSGEDTKSNPITKPLQEYFGQFINYDDENDTGFSDWSFFSRENILKRAGLNFSGEDLFNYQMRQLMPKIFESALGDKGFKADDFIKGKYFETMSIDDFVKKYDVDKSIFAGMFEGTGIEEFSSNLDKILAPFKSLSEAAEKLSSEGKIDISFEGIEGAISNLQKIVELLESLIGVYQQFSTVTKTGFDIPKLSDALKELDKAKPKDIEDIFEKHFGEGSFDGETASYVSSLMPKDIEGDDKYRQWAKNIASAADEAIVSLDKFKTEERELSNKPLSASFNLQSDDISKMSSELSKLTETIRQLFLAYKQINGLGDLEVKPLSYAYNGIEFEKLKAGISAARGGNVNKVKEYFGVDTDDQVKSIQNAINKIYNGLSGSLNPDRGSDLISETARTIIDSADHAGISLENFKQRYNEVFKVVNSGKGGVNNNFISKLSESISESMSGISGLDYLSSSIDNLISKVDELFEAYKKVNGLSFDTSELESILSTKNVDEKKYLLNWALKPTGASDDMMQNIYKMGEKYGSNYSSYANAIIKYLEDAGASVDKFRAKKKELETDNDLKLNIDDSLSQNIEKVASQLQELLSLFKEINALNFDSSKLANSLSELGNSDIIDIEKFKKIFGSEDIRQLQFVHQMKPDDSESSDYYSSWANNIINATDRAGLALTEFRTTQQISVGTVDIGGNQFESQVNKFIESINRLANEIKSMDVSGSLNRLETSLLNFAESYQKVNGLLSSSDLEKQFKKIQKSAKELSGLSIAKKESDNRNKADQLLSMYKSYIELGGTKQVKDLDTSANIKKYLTQSLNTEKSSSSAAEEADKLRLVNEAATSAAGAKREFADANKDLFSSIIKSVAEIDNEGKAFLNITKLINSIGGEKGGEKIKSVVDGLTQIKDLMSEPVGADSFIKSLETLSLSGDGIKDLATVLRASKQQMNNATKEVARTNQRNKSQAIVDNHLNEIRQGGLGYISTLDDGDVIGNKIQINNQGLIEMIALVKTVTGEYKELTVNMDKAGKKWMFGSEDTSERVQKRGMKYEENMRSAEFNSHFITDQIMFDKDNTDIGTWNQMIALAKTYEGEIGNLIKVTRQVREDHGLLKESFSFFGDNGGHVTMGREGDVDHIVASSQTFANLDEIETKLRNFSSAGKDYYELLQKVSSGDATAHEAERLQQLDSEWNDIISKVKEYNNVFGNNSAAQQLFDNTNDKLLGNYDKYLSKFTEKSSERIDKALQSRANQLVDFTPEYTEQLERAKSAIKEINDLRQSHGPGDFWLTDELQRVQTLTTEISTVMKGLTNNSNVLAKTADVDKLISKISKDLNDNTLSSGLKGRYQDLLDYLTRVRSAGDAAGDGISQINKVDLGHAIGQFQELHAEMERTGQTGKGFFKQFTGAITSKSAQFLAQYFSLQDFIRYGRELGQMVTQINSAQTELRKVSDASQTRIAENFETSAKMAQELGSTITDVINNTADWSRLGYSVDDAEKLARVTTLYQTVGDNMTQETASESLISTMKGFQLDADQAESVVDRINEVANNYAIDTAGIGEALQRSASAFNTAHTDLDKSIAIITASNTVLQDPEKVGTMWNTVAMRIRGASTE